MVGLVPRFPSVYYLLIRVIRPWISLCILSINWWDWSLDFHLDITYQLVGLVPGFSSVYYLSTSGIGHGFPSVYYLPIGGICPWISLCILFIKWRVSGSSSIYYLDWSLDFRCILFINWRVPGSSSIYYLGYPSAYYLWTPSVVHRSGRGREGGEPQVLGQDRA
jgi:hypothetical protein